MVSYSFWRQNQQLFSRKNNIDIPHKPIHKLHPMLKLPTLQNSTIISILKSNFLIMTNQPVFMKKNLSLSNKLENWLKRANYPEVSENEILKNVLHGYHTAYFSRANLQLSLERMQHFSSELESAATILKHFSIKFLQKFETVSFSVWKNPMKKHKIFFLGLIWSCTSE